LLVAQPVTCCMIGIGSLLISFGIFSLLETQERMDK